MVQESLKRSGRDVRFSKDLVMGSQRGDSPFVYRDRGGWPASLPYICKIRVSVAIGTQSGIRLHKRVTMLKIWGSSKNDQNQMTGKLLKLHFHYSSSFSCCCCRCCCCCYFSVFQLTYLKNRTELRDETL